MINSTSEDLLRLQENLDQRTQALEDAKWHLKQAKQDLASAKRAAVRVKSTQVKGLLARLGPAVTRVSLVCGRIYIQTANCGSDRLPLDAFKLLSNRDEGVTCHAEFIATIDEWRGVHIYNVYDPRKLIA